MLTQPSQGRGDNLRRQHVRVPDPKQASSSGAGPFNRFCQIVDLRKKRRQPAGQFSSFDRKVQATRSPVEQVNPECRFQLFDLSAQCGLRDMKRFGSLPKTSCSCDFCERHQLSQVEGAIAKMCHLMPLLYSNCSCFACNCGHATNKFSRPSLTQS